MRKSKMYHIRPLHDALFEYKDHYDNGGSDYSATDLISPPRVCMLGKRYAQEIKDRPVDPVKEIDSFSGSGLHSIFEENLKSSDQYVLERRETVKLLNRKISGCPDIYYWPGKVLYDIKMTKAWKKIFSDLHEWEWQLNIYAYLLYLTRAIKVRRIAVIAWWKNWEMKSMMDNPKYPREPVEEIRLKLWPLQKQEDFLYERLGMIMDAEDLEEEALPYCTKEDRWDRAESWAVYRYVNNKKPKKASRVLYSIADAERWIKKMVPKGIKHELEHRKGFRVRCEDWCDVSEWCTQFKLFKEGK